MKGSHALPLGRLAALPRSMHRVRLPLDSLEKFVTLEEAISSRVGLVRTDSFDMSFGEVASLHNSEELIIQPEYQRLFRWSIEQESQLIESILLELPIPQIFVIENHDGVLELIDGLQRISTVLHFMDAESIGMDPLRLDGCSLIRELNGMTFVELPLSLRLGLKRTPIRVVIIKKQSQAFLRYEMFKRLNTGGANLAPQEIRNCSARMIGDSGIRFYSFLIEQSLQPDFAACTAHLPDEEREKKGAEELVLRFFAAKNSIESFKGSVRDWLDGYMEAVLLGIQEFNYEIEKSEFIRVMKLAHDALGETAFLRYRGTEPTGSLPPAYFEAISIGLHRVINDISGKNAHAMRDALTVLIQSAPFRDVTGPGANSKGKLIRRIELVSQAMLAA